MASNSPWNLYVGAETGFLKGIYFQKKLYRNLNTIATADRTNEIDALCWENKEENKVLCGLRNRLIKCYDEANDVLITKMEISGGEGPIKGLATADGSLVSCVESGLVRVWKGDKHQLEINAGPAIHRMRINSNTPTQIATGGKENCLKLWDLNSPQEPVFIAKNVRHDFLNLRVPVWITDMQFIPDSSKVVVCTGYHHIRVYDPSTPQRRPVLNVEYEEDPLTALSLPHKENTVIVGSARGRMALFDLRRGSLVHCFKGFAGGIRCIQCHPTRPLVASCGLDRFVRVHDTDTKKLLYKIYLKSRLNCLLFKRTWDLESDEITMQKEVPKQNVKPSDNDEDTMWAEMEAVSDDEGTGNVKRKRKRRAVNISIKNFKVK